MPRPRTDPRWPSDVEYPSLYRVVCDATPGDMTDEERAALTQIPDGEAHKAIVETGSWTGPDGTTYVAVMDERSGTMVCGYKKLRDKDWFVAKDKAVLAGPFRTKRACLAHVRAKRGRTVEAGWYRAKGHDVFTRDMAEKVTGERIE